MLAIRFAVSFKAHTEWMSSFYRLDCLFARSYKAKKNGRVIGTEIE